MGTRFRRLIVPIDGSPCAEAALDFALRLAAPAGHLILAHAIDRGLVAENAMTALDGDLTGLFDDLDDEERHLFADAMERVAAAGLSASTASLDGPTYVEIVAAARRHEVDAIVMGTTGRGGIVRAFVGGGIAQHVARHAEVPVFVVHGDTPPPPGVPLRRILVAFDASPPAAAALRLALELAVEYRAELVLCHVDEGDRTGAQTAALERARALAEAAHVRVGIVSAIGKPIDAIVTSALAGEADLIAVGTHGRHGPARLVLGSVAEGLVFSSTVPVVVVHERRLAAAAPG